MQILHEVFRCKTAGIFRSDIEAASKSHKPVDDEQLAMIAHIEKRHAPGNPGVQEARDRNPYQFKTPQGARPDIVAAHAVKQNTHGNTARPGLAEGRHEICAHRVIAENIGRQRNALFGGSDRLQHERIGDIAALQDDNLVACRQGGLRNALADVRQGRDVVAAFGRATNRPPAWTLATLSNLSARLVTRLMPNRK